MMREHYEERGWALPLRAAQARVHHLEARARRAQQADLLRTWSFR